MGVGGSRSSPRFRLTAEDIVKECSENSSIKDRKILVTGATSGIGLETARVLAIAGAKVHVMGRSETKVKEVIDMINKQLEDNTHGGSVTPALCDLNSLQSIKSFAEKFNRVKTPLNVLVLNAGIFNGGFHQTVDGLEQVMGVNHIGHAYLTKLLMPTLIANGPSRVVLVSSKLHDGPALRYEQLERMCSNQSNAGKGWSISGSYQQSKLANLLFARAIASKYKSENVTAYSLHPGVIATNLGSTIPFSHTVMKVFGNKTIAQGAATTVYCSIAPNIECETGRYFDNSTVTNCAEKWTDADVEKFWEWTETILRNKTANLE